MIYLAGYVASVFPQVSGSEQYLWILDLRQVDLLLTGEENTDVVANDPHQECDENDGEEHPQPDGRVKPQLRLHH